MLKLLKAMIGSVTEKKATRSLNSLSELQINDYVRLSDSYVLPDEIKGQTFQVVSIDSYYYVDRVNIEWVLKGGSTRKIFMSISDSGSEDRIVLSYQLKTKEVETTFGWEKIKRQFKPDCEEALNCQDTTLFEGWLASTYNRRECGGKGSYFSGDFRAQPKPSGGEALTYFEFYNDDESHAVDVEMWSKDEIDVFISILRPESDIHEYWAG